MRIHLIGSAAGKIVPRPFCRCSVCAHARLNGGRDVRTRTAVHLYLDGEETGEPRYGIDLSPDTAHHMIREGFCLDRLEHLLFTHRDEDHFFPSYLKVRPSILSNREALPWLTLYGSATVGEAFAAEVPHAERIRATFRQVDPFQQFQVGEFQVFSLLAHHGPGTVLHYVVQAEGKSILCAWDTGWWPEETWEAVADFQLDAVFMECTILGPSKVDKEAGHLNFATLLEMKAGLAARGCIAGDTPYTTLHIGDNGGLTYAEACDLAQPHGITVGYDGLWVEV